MAFNYYGDKYRILNIHIDLTSLSLVNALLITQLWVDYMCKRDVNEVLNREIKAYIYVCC